MPLLLLIVIALWTLLVLRVAGARATLGERTLATYLVLGALLAIAAAPPLASLISPYNQQPSGLALVLLSMGRLALVLAPVAYALGARQSPRVLSVADAFLLAFAVGFGFDLIGAVVTASASSQILAGLSFLPPWQIVTEQRTVVAGHGYWAGLVALAYAAGQRFIRRPQIVWAVTLLAFLLVSLQAAALATAVRPTGPLGWALTLTLDGAATAWVALASLVGLSVWEAYWANRLTAGETPPAAGFIVECQARLLALARGRPGEYASLGARQGRERQSQLERAEARRDQLGQREGPLQARPLLQTQRLPTTPTPSQTSGLRPPTAPTPPPISPPISPPTLPPTVPLPAPTRPLPRPGPLSPPEPSPPAPSPPEPSPPAGSPRPAETETPPPLVDDERPTPRPTPRRIMGGALDDLAVPYAAPDRSRSLDQARFWRHTGLVQVTLVLALLVVVVVLPNLPLAISRVIWSFPLLSLELKQPPLTILNIVVVLLLLWWYVAAAGRPSSDSPDDLVRFVGERAILHASLASVVLVLLAVRNTFLYPFYSVVAVHTRTGFPGLEVYQAQTLLLLLSAAAVAVTLDRAAAWRQAPLQERRASAVHNAISVMLILVLSWVVVALYLPTLGLFHEYFGTILFAVFGQSGNVIGGYVMIVFSGLLSWLTLRVLRPLAEQVEQFLVAE